MHALTQELDGKAWDAQEAAGAPETDQAEYLRRFRMARAANAVWCALGEDPWKAATEATNEAVAATEDLEAVRTVLFEARS